LSPGWILTSSILDRLVISPLFRYSSWRSFILSQENSIAKAPIHSHDIYLVIIVLISVAFIFELRPRKSSTSLVYSEILPMSQVRTNVYIVQEGCLAESSIPLRCNGYNSDRRHLFHLTAIQKA